MKNEKFNFLTGLKQLNENNQEIKNSNNNIEISVDDNLRFEFSDLLINYLTKVRDDPMYDGEITMARFKSDIKSTFGYEAAEIIDLFIFLELIDSKTTLSVK